MKESLSPSDDRYPGYRKVEIPALAIEKAALRTRVIGQEEAIGVFASLFVKIISGIRSVRPGPIDAKFLAGPSGVGKTELVYTLAELLAGNDPEARKKVLKINGGEYQHEQRHNLSKLWGAPPGYIGSEDPANLGSRSEVVFSKENLDAHRIHYTDRNGQQQSVILVLVDEAEKADYSFHMGFLSILDKGEMDLANNSKADFRDAVIFYTSNVGNYQVEKRHGRRIARTDIPLAFQEVVEEVVFKGEDRELLVNEFTQAFPSEFRGRIQETIVFNHLSHEAIGAIAQMKVREVEASFAASGIRIELDLSPEVNYWLVKNGYSRSEGARGVDKLVKSSIMERLLTLDVARDIVVLASGIHRKRIGMGVNEEGTGLEFYFGEGFQLPDPLQKAEAVIVVDVVDPVQLERAKEIIAKFSQNPTKTQQPQFPTPTEKKPPST